MKRSAIIMIGAAVLLAVLVGYGGYRYRDLSHARARLAGRVAELESLIAKLTTDLTVIRAENADLILTLTAERDKNNSLAGTLHSEQEKNRNYEAQIRDISGVVGALEKLQKLDPELLMKYSKVYFLSENYTPPNLTAVNPQYILNPDRPYLILGGAAPFLEAMLNSAARDGASLKVVSGYRSFAEQAAVKTGYKVLYGSGANQFSADQGYSEHQLGTTVDLTAASMTGLGLAFEKTPGYKWLMDNAHKFGFVLSYPRSNSYYQFEPWHWRFVGVALATRLHGENRHFYELTQREIDPYLLNIFD